MNQHAELLTQPTNYAVVQLPGRKKPGVVFQGDSLHSLVQRLALLHSAMKRKRLREATEEVLHIGKELNVILTTYEKVCAEHDIELPYTRTPDR